MFIWAPQLDFWIFLKKYFSRNVDIFLDITWFKKMMKRLQKAKISTRKFNISKYKKFEVHFAIEKIFPDIFGTLNQHANSRSREEEFVKIVTQQSKIPKEKAFKSKENNLEFQTLLEKEDKEPEMAFLKSDRILEISSIFVKSTNLKLQSMVWILICILKESDMMGLGEKILSLVLRIFDQRAELANCLEDLKIM